MLFFFVCKCIIFAGKAFIKGYCCSYNTDCGKTATGFDCALIPSPSKLADGASLAIAFEGFCGGELSTIANSIDAKTVCCKYIINIKIEILLSVWSATKMRGPTGLELGI